MPGRIYTFERDPTAQETQSGQLVSSDALKAVVSAANDAPEIRFEELTGPENPKPVIVVLFANNARIEPFNELITTTLDLCGVKVRDVRYVDD